MFRRHAILIALLSLLTSLTVAFGAPANAADKDCGDFESQKRAQVFFLNNGGPQSDPHRLDSDGDGIACESNPCPCYYGQTPPGDTTGGAGGTGPAQLKQRARVLSVVDGDTVKVRIIGGARRTVRLIGIDTPEVYGGVECGGPQASRALKRLLPRGTRVRLLSDTSQDRVDRYDRILRYVMKGKRDLNKTQVARGWARVYVYDNNPFNRVKSYRSAESRAKNAPRGIWKHC